MKTANKLIVAFLTVVIFLVVVVLFLPANIEASKQVIVGPDQSFTSDELSIGAQTAITVINAYGEANLSQHLTGGFSDPQIVASSDYVAAVYRGVNGSVYLQATKNISGWYGTPVTLGQGSVPDLAISGTNVVHAVWLKSGNEVVEYKKCTLGPTTATCDTTATVLKSDTNEILNNPVIAISGNGFIHVAWAVQSAGKVQSRIHNGSSWNPGLASTPTEGITGLTAPQQAAIAAATDKVILAIINGTGGGIAGIYNSPIGTVPHNWTNRANFNAAAAGGFTYDKVDSIGLAATGSGAYLAWSISDTALGVDDNVFKLAGSTGSNSGDSWTAASYITSANSYVSTSSDIDKRRSKDSSSRCRKLGCGPAWP